MLMKDMIKFVLEFVIGLLKYIPEKWHDNKWFWLFWIAVSSIAALVFTYVFC